MKKIVILILILAIGIAALPSKVTEVSAYTLTNDSIRAREEEIANARQVKDELQGNLTDVEAVKQELEQSKANLDQYVRELDGNLLELETKITELLQMISDKEQEIKVKEEELNEALAVQQSQYEAMKRRIKFMYERGDSYLLEVIFGAEDFSDIVNKAEYIEQLTEYDRNKLNEYILNAEYIALSKEVLEEERAVIEQAHAVVEEEQAATEELKEEKGRQIDAVSNDINNKEQAIREYEAQIAMENDTIAALERANAEERAKLAAEQNRKYDGGQFALPVASYTRISDYFGPRPVHPVLGIPTMHNGLDLAAPAGTDIYAAYQGEVIAADYNGSMGNYIMIDHGDGLITIYMHASQLFVSKGTEVSRGQRIASVGSTGVSTGNHLHFGVRINGAYVDPLGYI
ncbi:MAG: peptidoglycan DD-metalloendopeptidase family protein [Lachnospiraceae bacterium]|nr:peptidoglycan DD-metalloendopeptidase family protein [Lachnospiraceae bacterium]